MLSLDRKIYSVRLDGSQSLPRVAYPNVPRCGDAMESIWAFARPRRSGAYTGQVTDFAGNRGGFSAEETWLGVFLEANNPGAYIAPAGSQVRVRYGEWPDYNYATKSVGEGGPVKYDLPGGDWVNLFGMKVHRKGPPLFLLPRADEEFDPLPADRQGGVFFAVTPGSGSGAADLRIQGQLEAYWTGSVEDGGVSFGSENFGIPVFRGQLPPIALDGPPPSRYRPAHAQDAPSRRAGPAAPRHAAERAVDRHLPRRRRPLRVPRPSALRRRTLGGRVPRVVPHDEPCPPRRRTREGGLARARHRRTDVRSRQQWTVPYLEAHKRHTRAVNFREGVRGRMFQGRFGSCVLDERHLMAAARYVELNPVAAGIVDTPEAYEWSSARFHLDGRVKRDELVRDRTLMGLLPEPAEWRELLADGVAEIEEARLAKHLATGRPLGETEFVRGLERRTGRRLVPRKGGWPKGRKRGRRGN